MAPSKAEQAYTILKERILNGSFGPGYRLVIDQLTRDFGITSVPWRESLRRLQAEGWVEMVPNVGALVSTFDDGAWERTLRLLARLEGLATAISAPNLTESEITEARELNREMALALDNADLVRIGRLNREFHRVLCSRTEDPRLSELLDTEWQRLEFIRRTSFWDAPGRALASLSEHESLLDLIEGDADQEIIETAARRHEVNTLLAVKKHAGKLVDQR